MQNTKKLIKKVLIILLVLFVGIIVLAAFFGSDDSKQPNNTIETNQPNQQTTQEETQPITQAKPYDYEKTITSTDGVIGKEIQVYVKEFDIEASDMKERIKETINAVAKGEGTTDLMVFVYSDKDYYNYESMTDPDDLISEKYKALTEKMKQVGVTESGLVAAYTGGFNMDTYEKDTSDNGYLLEFYLNAPKDNAEVGKYKEDIKGWKASLE